VKSQNEDFVNFHEKKKGQTWAKADNFFNIKTGIKANETTKKELVILAHQFYYGFIRKIILFTFELRY
jgi:hypothetical protein